MIYKIREIEKNEYELLNEFLYEAIFIPEGMEKPPKDIIKNKELQVYVKNFGTKLYFFVHIKIYRNLSEGGKKIPY